MPPKIIAKNKSHLLQLINQEIKLYGNDCNLNHVDASKITDMSFLFMDSQFNRNINDWNVSKVTYIRSMFNQCQCEKPWWYIEDNKTRKEVMEKYQLMNDLDKEISQSKKNKL